MRRCIVSLILYSAMVVGSPLPTAAQQEEARCLRIAHFDSAVIRARLQTMGKIIFRDAGLCIDLHPMPVRRAEQMSVLGKLDGELMRTRYWLSLHKDEMVAVPTPVAVTQMFAVTLKKRNLEFKSLDDLVGFRVVITGGHRWAEDQLSNRGIDPIQASTLPRFLELLRFRRIDVGLMESSVMLQLGEQPDIRAASVADLSYHIVLRKEVAHHVSALDVAVQKWHNRQDRAH